MGINPVTALKRRLEDEATPLSKRLCLASNLTKTQYLPTSAKERAIVDWLDCTDVNGEVVESVLAWHLDDAGNEFLSKLVQVIAKFLEINPQHAELTEKLATFLDNDKIMSQLTLQIDSYLLIVRTLLTNLVDSDIAERVALCKRLFESLKKVFKNSTRKVDFIVKFLVGENLETLFRFLSDRDLRNASLSVCETILFPLVRKGHFSTFLQMLIRQENLDDSLNKKGDSMKCVMKVMSTLFTFPKDRTSKDEKFLIDFIDAFVSSFKTESHLIFMFLIMAINSLNIQQTYLNPAMTMPAIIFEDNDSKIKRNIILRCLEILKENEINLNVKLTEILGEKMTKVEIKKNFVSFLQATLMSVLKLEGKPDKTTLKLITTSLKLDPNLMEPKLDVVLPNIMICKKQKSIQDTYVEMLNYLMDTLFKLGRGTDFIQRILPSLKIQLEAINAEQFELKQHLEDVMEDESYVEKLKGKIITGCDLMPETCVDKYGRLTSELMLKQNGELFVSLQKEFETHCLILLEDGFVSPSLMTLSQVLSAILSRCIDYSKMADHAVPTHIATEFWTNFILFRDEFLAKYGQIVIKLNYNRDLTCAFLRLCSSYVNLELIHLRYGNITTDNDAAACSKLTDVEDFNSVLPCLTSDQWLKMSKKIREMNDTESINVLNMLMMQKIVACDLWKTENSNASEHIHKLRTHLIGEIDYLWNILEACPYYADILFNGLDSTQEQNLAKALVKKLENDKSVSILNISTEKNKSLITTITTEMLKIILKIIEDDEFLKVNKSIRKAIKAGFEFEQVVKGSDSVTIFHNLSKSKSLTDADNQSRLLNFLEVLSTLQISVLDENAQLLTIFIVLAIKRMILDDKFKKLRKLCDQILLHIFEISPKHPNLFKIFPIEYIFSFNNNFISLLTLSRLKTNRSIIIKSTLESAVKKVKTDSEIIKSLVKILLTTKSKRVDFYNDSCQTICMILPIIAKEKKAITNSQYRSILADLQEKLHKFLLKSFKNTNFDTGNSDDLAQDSEGNIETLNAMEAYALTLSKCCESNKDGERDEDLNNLMSSSEHFMNNGISAIENSESKLQHVEASLQLLNVTLRNIRHLENNTVFQNKDEIFTKIWNAVKARLHLVVERQKSEYLDDIAITLKFLSELCTPELFSLRICSDLTNMMEMKSPQSYEENSAISSHKMAKYVVSSILKSNIIGQKSAALAKTVLKACRNVISWIRDNFGSTVTLADLTDDMELTEKKFINPEVNVVLGCYLDTVTDVVVNAKKIALSWRFLDNIFMLHHSLANILAQETSDEGFLTLISSKIFCLNALTVHRHQLLQDRWPCFLQCYRSVVKCLCLRASCNTHTDRQTEERTAEVAHSLEKLTQAVCRQKSEINRLAAYLVADFAFFLETAAPSRPVRQHMENCVVLLIQVSESTHSSAFLRRALAGNPGHMTMANLYLMYKRYHKYVGTS